MHRNTVCLVALTALATILAASEIAAATYRHRWTAFPQDSRIKVVTSTPQIAEIVRCIAGRKAHVLPLTKAKQNDPHAKLYRSMIRAANKADLLIRMGADCDPWVDEMFKSTKNSRIAPGSAGYVDCSKDASVTGGESQTGQHKQSQAGRSFSDNRLVQPEIGSQERSMRSDQSRSCK